jgi:abequosyltransferase
MEIMKLSICIATYNRGKFITETLDSILGQIEPTVEVVVVDGASKDDTPEIMGRYASNYPQVHYFRELVNSGVDADFDKAVGYAKGEFCWLMTDDDLLLPDAIATVLSSLTDENDLIVLNSELRNLDLSVIYDKQRLILETGKEYRKDDSETFFIDTASYLSFIGCVVIRRTYWLSRDRSAYYGTLFIHVGVIFQSPPIQNIKVLAKPLITIRYGNAMWTPRGFEIWMFKWPNLIWSFPDFSDAAKGKVNQHEPWHDAFKLFYYRALGAYNSAEFRRLWPRDTETIERVIAYAISVFPASLANFLAIFYFSTRAKQSKMVMHDFLHATSTSFLSRLLAKTLRLEKI